MKALGKKALITGSQGFVGKYLWQELAANAYTVVGLDRQPGAGCRRADLLDYEQVYEVLAEVQPDYLVHLAGQADVAKSWREPQLTFELNILGTINLLEALRAVCPQCRLLLIGSADEYGNLGEAGQNVTEDIPLRPQTPYAVSKKAQEELAFVYTAAYSLSVICTRSFNHGGAGQRPGFMIPDFASGIARIEKGLADKLLVGNLEARRDFTHVKDVVRAYRLLLERGRSGEIYNVGSGITYSAGEILDRLLAMAECAVKIEQDAARMRPSDAAVICCNNSKLRRDTGWQPEFSIEDILRDALADWRGRQK